MEAKDDGGMEMLNKSSNTSTKLCTRTNSNCPQTGFNHLNLCLRICVEELDLNLQQHESREMYVCVQ